MTPPQTAEMPPDPDQLTVNLASTLLQLGLSAPRRPVDGLLERLDAPDGHQWFEAALALVCGPTGPPREVLCSGDATVDELTSIKERSKKLLKRATDSESSLAGIAGYFLAIAAGLRHHGRLIGGRSRAELDPILLDVASAVPSPYSELLSDATLVKADRDVR